MKWIELLGALVCEAKSDSHGKDEHDARVDADHSALFTYLWRATPEPLATVEVKEGRISEETVLLPDGNYGIYAKPPKGHGSDEYDIESAAKALATCMDYPWAHMLEQGRKEMRKHARAVVDAARGPQ
jgi:hypothetical protein